MNNTYGIPDHLFTIPLPQDRWSFTLAGRMSRCILEMEKRYGDRDGRWTLLGLEFCEGVPNIWFPGGNEQPPRMHITIRLGHKAFNDEKRAVYQLAHECVHLLAPVEYGKAKVIEEGLATAFSEDIIEMWFGEKNKADYTNDPRYRDAAGNVRQLLKQAPDAIRRLRRVEPAFSSMTADTFGNAGLGAVPQTLISELLQIF